MTATLPPCGRGRLLVIATPREVEDVVREHGPRPLVVMLTNGALAEGDAAFSEVVNTLLDYGCDYFVCAGLTSEQLHDRVDDVVVERGLGGLEVVTTWHDDEPVSEVTEFFLNVAGRRERALLCAVLGPAENELASSLVRQVEGDEPA